jgi:8-oxo-dGTP diphosphatase
MVVSSTMPDTRPSHDPASSTHPLPDHIEVLARAAILSEGHVLLCRDTKGGYSYLPGGHIEPGESASTAVLRELQEEAVLSVTIGPLGLVAENLFVQKGRAKQEITLVFHVEHALSPTTPVTSLESHLEFWWAELASLIDLDVRPGSAKAWLLSLGAESINPPISWASEQTA